MVKFGSGEAATIKNSFKEETAAVGKPQGLYTNGLFMVHMVQNRNNSGNLGSLDSEIVLLLLKGGRHLRGIAKQLGQSHSTVFRRLRKLQQENVLDYRTEGRNKVFFIKKNLQARNYVLAAERHKFIKLLKKYPELSIIISDTLRSVKESLIVLFGSYAKFSAKKDSDIDIYIETRKREVKENAEKANSRISAKIGTFDLDSALLKEIVKDHVILRGEEEFYEKTGLFE